MILAVSINIILELHLLRTALSHVEEQHDLAEIPKACCNKPRDSSLRLNKQVLQAKTALRASDVTALSYSLLCVGMCSRDVLEIAG